MDKVKELEKKIAELESQLELEKSKQRISVDEQDYGLWEYDIFGKRLIQRRKLNGKWSNNSLIVENYREQMKEWNLVHPEDMSIFEKYCDSLDRGDAHVMSEMRSLRDNGRFAWLRYEGNAVYDKKGVPIKIVGRILDITQEKRDKELLEREVTRDTLTGLYGWEVSRKMIEKKLEESPDANGAVIIVDIDNFKSINEKFGRVYGDTILEVASNIIYTSFKAKDIVGRITGDAFLIYCADLKGEQNISKLVDKMLVHFQDFMEERDGYKCSVSVGISLYPRDGRKFEDLYQHADIALLKAKRSGKNQYGIYQKDEDYGTALGKTYRKMKEQDRKEISAAKQLNNVNKELFDFAFKEITSEKDFQKAMQTILEEVSLYFSLDRSTLMECDKISREIHATAKWSRQNDGDDSKWMEKGAGMDWYALEKYLRSMDYNVFENGKNAYGECATDILCMNKVPVSAIQFPIMDGDKLAGLLTFESW